jgi:hypothetical protein
MCIISINSHLFIYNNLSEIDSLLLVYHSFIIFFKRSLLSTISLILDLLNSLIRLHQILRLIAYYCPIPIFQYGILYLSIYSLN